MRNDRPAGLRSLARLARLASLASLVPLAALACTVACDASMAPPAGTSGEPSNGNTPAPGSGAGAAGASGADGGASSPGSTPGAPGPAAPSTIAVTFRTTDTGQYLSAASGGALTAASNTAGSAETFALADANGGALNDGDEVTLAAANGAYLSAAGGGGAGITASAATAGPDETFLVVRVDGPGVIAAGDHVALETKQTVSYVSAINGGGGDVQANAPWDRAWETFTLGVVGGAGADGGAPPPSGGPAATAKQKVLAYLASISGTKALVGIEDKDASHPTSDTDQMTSITGKTPSFWSADWGFGSSAVSNRQTIVDEGKRQFAAGAVVQYIYHTCPLTGDEYCGWDDIGGASPKHLSEPQWSELVTPGTALNKVWLGRLDTIAPFFQQLKDAGVAPLFRVLHEMNQGAFWWGGRPGPDGDAKLYQITHDYLVNAKGLDNIIWVWNLQDFTSLASDVTTYNPGATYFDIAALDVYNTGYTTGNYDAMKKASSGKPIGIGECQFMPTAALLAQQPLWAYVALWPDFTSQNSAALPALYSAPNVVTLGGMPGWK